MSDRGGKAQATSDLKVRTQKRLPLGVLEVVPHQQVQQGGGLATQRPQFGHAALQHLVAHGGAQRHAPLEQNRGELPGNRGTASSHGRLATAFYTSLDADVRLHAVTQTADGRVRISTLKISVIERRDIHFISEPL